MYLYRQYVSVYGQVGHCEDLDGKFFTSPFATREELVAHELSILKKEAGEYYEDALSDAGGLYEGDDYRGYDGYARTYEHIDNIRLVGEVTEEEVAALMKFGAM